jgi:hypothetical protein
MIYRRTLKVADKIYDRLERMVRASKRRADMPKSGTIFDEEVTFRNGNRVAIQVCACEDDTPYVQAVLFNKNGDELGCSCCDYSFGGEYIVTDTDTGDDYFVNVLRENPAKNRTPWRVESVARLTVDSTRIGYQIMDGDDVLVEMFEGNGWSKTKMRKTLRLMAAAPELLDALIVCSDYLAEFFEEGREHRVIRQADKLINKLVSRKASRKVKQ